LAIPGGDADGGIMGEAVGIVLPGVPEGAGVEPLAKKHRVFVADLGGVAGVKDSVGQMRDDVEFVVEFAQEERTRVGRDSG